MYKTSSRPVNVATLLTLLLLIIFTLHLLDNARSAGNSVVGHYHDAFSTFPKVLSKKPKLARRLYPEDLMQRPLATDLTRIPKLFHQSWINGTLPAKFEEWSHSCRAANADWEWVLWTDEDNLKLVERFAPWFLKAYKDLRTEIYRADVARNVYMHVFGGCVPKPYLNGKQTDSSRAVYTLTLILNVYGPTTACSRCTTLLV